MSDFKCPIKTESFDCMCCDEDLCARNKAYQQGRADAIEEFLALFCDKNNQSNFITLSHHHHSWNSYAKHVAEQLKEQRNDK